jgi:GWxTD domain-containing protein
VDGFSLAGTSSGPARTLFAERVRAADARFGGLRRGSLTDRGRVYVRYGEPDEVHKELLPTEENQIASFLDREVSDDERMEAGSFVRRSPLDASAYEVWYYAYWGEPLIPGQEPPARGRSLEFVFVDELGNGQYRLIYSNLFGGLH